MSLFPTLHTDVFVNGAWTSMTKTDGDSAIQGNPGITIQRGRPNERSAIIPTTADFVINDPDGRYSNKNPLSPFFGLLGRNTPFRVRADEGAGDGWAFLNNRTDSRARVRTPDVAALDIVGDIDIRIDCEPHSWRPDGSRVLISKSGATTAISWSLSYTGGGQLRFSSSSDSTTRITYDSGYRVPVTARRLTIRVTLDVDNGASGKTATFYIGTTGVNGSFTQVAQVVLPGTTAIHSGSASLLIGTLDAGTTNSYFAPGRGFQGKVFAAQVRSSIGGTIVANPDFTSADIDSTSIVDSTGKTWTLLADIASDIRFSNNGIRYYGEIPSWPVQWENGEKDVTVPLQASGILRRLQKNDSLKSTLYRRIKAFNPTAWWSFEDAQNTISSAVPGGISQAFPDAGNRPAVLTNCDFSSTDDLVGSGGAVRISDATSRIIADVPTYTSSGTWTAVWITKMDGVPSTFTLPMVITSNGTCRKWEVQFDSGGIGLLVVGFDGQVIQSDVSTFGGYDVTKWGAFRLQVSESGGTVSWVLGAYQLNGTSQFTFASGSFAGTIGVAKQFQVFGSLPDIPGTLYTHMYLVNSAQSFTTATIVNAMNGYSGPNNEETAIERMERLCEEEGIPFYYLGDYQSGGGQNMGPQQVDRLLTLLDDAVRLDGGILLEQRDYPGLVYIARTRLYSNNPLALDYSASYISKPFKPTDGDSALRNDITVSRRDGGYYRAVQDTGINNVQDPGTDPNAVGRYVDGSVAINADTVAQLPFIAEWLRSLGVTDRERYESIRTELHRAVYRNNASLIESMAGMDIGNWFELTNLPSLVPPDDVPVIVQFYIERIANLTWEMTWTTAPADPWIAAVYGDHGDITNSNDNGSRYDSAFSSVNTAFSAGVGTSLSVKMTAGKKLWTTGSSSPKFPFDIEVGKVRLRVTQISGASSPQTFTVQQAPINGVIKTIPVDTPVRLYRGKRWAF